MKRDRRLVGRAAASWALLFMCSGPAFAEERPLCPICSKANDNSASYAENAGNTLARGALNLSLGWTELIRQPAKKARSGGNVFFGIANGIGHSLSRTMKGAGEVLTFWVPKTRGEYLHFSKDCPLDTVR